MVKTVLGVNHQGVRDWLVQRVSAVVMAVYSVGLMLYFVLNGTPEYSEWHRLFSCTLMKIATLLFLASLLLHAWVGLWTVFTDYVKPFWLRLMLHTVVLLMLVSCFFAGLLILWGI